MGIYLLKKELAVVIVLLFLATAMSPAGVLIAQQNQSFPMLDPSKDTQDYIHDGSVSAILLDPSTIMATEKIHCGENVLFQHASSPFKDNSRITTNPLYDGKPELCIDTYGNMLVMYETEEIQDQSHIKLSSTEDNGKTWDTVYFYDTLHPDYINMSSPSLDHYKYESESDDMAGCGVFVHQGNDPAVYRWYFHELIWTNIFSWEIYGDIIFDVLSNLSTTSTACYSWNWVNVPYHIFAIIADWDESERHLKQCPTIWFTYQEFSFLIYALSVEHCSNISLEIDQMNGNVYLACEIQNGTNQDIILLINSVENLENAGWGTWEMMQIGGTHNDVHPSVDAHDGYVYLTVESDRYGNKDILCYSSEDEGKTWNINSIGMSDSDDKYPSMYVISGNMASCAFFRNDDVYLSDTRDGGVTWSSPEKINDMHGSVVNEYHCVGVTDGGMVWMDNRNGNSDIYFDLIQGSNEPPDKPNIAGPSTGKIGEKHNYTFSAFDPDGDDIWYYVNWGDDQVDEWIGPFPSGFEVKIGHTWEEKGTYIISAKSKDNAGKESEWATFAISMPKNRLSNNPLFLPFIEKLLHPFPLLARIF